MTQDDDATTEVPLPPGPGLVVFAGRSPATFRSAMSEEDFGAQLHELFGLDRSTVASIRLDAQLMAWQAMAAPEPEQVRAACETLRRTARAQIDAERGADTLAADRVAVLETGLLFRDKHGTQPCPVCMEGVLDDGWVQRARMAMAKEQEAVQSLRAARSASFRARQVLAALVKEVSPPPAEDAGLATVAAAHVAHQTLSAIPAEGDAAFADHVDARLPPLTAAYDAVRSEAVEAGERLPTDAGEPGGLSLGELRALALAMVVSTDEDADPSRLGLDDPTRTIDPARIGCFVEVLERLAINRQVVVFSADARLLDAVRSSAGTARVVDVG